MSPLPLVPMAARVRALRRFYDDRLRELTEILGRAVSGGEPQAIRSGAAAEKIIKFMDAYARRWSRGASLAALGEANGRLRVTLEVLGFERPASATLGILAANTATAIGLHLLEANRGIWGSVQVVLHLTRTGRRQVGQLQAWGSGDLLDAEGIITRWAQVAVEEGWSRERLSTKITQYLLNMLGSGGLVRVAGRNYKMGYYAEMVARTELRKSQTKACEDLCNAYKCDLVRFSSHNDPCSKCAVHEGQVFSISGTSKKYPPLTDEVRPPLHPSCEHSLTPTTEIAMEIRSRRGHA